MTRFRVTCCGKLATARALMIRRKGRSVQGGLRFPQSYPHYLKIVINRLCGQSPQFEKFHNSSKEGSMLIRKW